MKHSRIVKRTKREGDTALSPFFVWMISCLLFVACENKKNQEGALYTGPIEIVNNVEVKYSEQGHIKILVKTPKSNTYSNENKIFPDTVNISFFDSLGNVITTLRSDSGKYDKTNDLYVVKGKVRVVKSETQETLTTSELNWSPRTRKIYTDKPLSVKNTKTREVTNAIGMDAEQDFTRIKFRKATGIYKLTQPPGTAPTPPAPPQ